ncbi:hypothetical protein BsWGS_19536 [Bradybaena similaris]
MADYYIGVDVGTASVRACVVDAVGQILSVAVEEITIWNPQPDHYQQSSDEIWSAVIKTVRAAVSGAKVKPERIMGMGFDATCSLVVLGEEFQPLTVSLEGEVSQNIIMWMDHRAQREADEINATRHRVLRSVGGIMSLEMQPPKLKWLKRNMPTTWQRAAHLFDLPDFLTWRATGSLSRSLCSVVCKWGFQADGDGMCWDDDFLSLIDLGDLTNNNHSKLGNIQQDVGSPCGSGLTSQAAEELGLIPGTHVGTSMIDAHAGALACVGCTSVACSQKQEFTNLDNRIVLIAGTSTCHIICTQTPVPVPGVWGPYYSAMVPGMWVNEGGQSAAGRLIDFVSSGHPAFSEAKTKAANRGLHVYEYLNDHLQQMAVRNHCQTVAHLTQDFHVWPDFHGNRSPVADPSLRGMVTGLSLSATEDDLALVYLATIQALAYGTCHIVTDMEKSCHVISTVYLCGGLRKNRLYVQTHADVLGLPVVLPEVDQSVLLGAAMLGAFASGKFASLQSVMAAMGGQGSVVDPDTAVSSFHEKKFQVFLEMLRDQQKYRNMMKDVSVL